MVVAILLAIALALLLAAAFGASSPKVSLMPLGLAFAVAAMLYPLLV